MPRRPGSEPAAGRGAAGRWRPAPGYLVLALACGVGGPLLAWLAAPGGEGEAPAQPPTVVARAAPDHGAPRALPAPTAAPAAAVPATTIAPVALSAQTVPAAPAIQRQRDPNGDQSPDLADFVNPGEHPTMAEVIARLHAAGVRSGLGAFQPPGTRPPLVGLAVPADFELPVGYVRHHQATDDGQRIEAILMFSPDHTWVDAAGRPLALPADRVVPPEMAPPGLPIRRIVVPAPVEPGR